MYIFIEKLVITSPQQPASQSLFKGRRVAGEGSLFWVLRALKYSDPIINTWEANKLCSSNILYTYYGWANIILYMEMYRANYDNLLCGI